MTRARKFDPVELEREYVYDPAPKPISISGLAARHGMARSQLADMAIRGEWFRKRKEFRTTVGMRVTEQLADEWAIDLTGQRRKMIDAMVKTLDKYVERLDAGEINPSVRDAVSVAGALRVLIADMVASAPADETPLDPTEIELSPTALADFIERARGQLGSGKEDADDADFRTAETADDPLDGDAGELGPTGTEGTRQN